MKTRSLIVITALLVTLPLIPVLQFYIGGRVLADEISVSASIVMTLTVIFSMVSWFLFSWASKIIRFAGILLSIITGASLIIPFAQVLGPMAGIIVGVVAGFAAFMFQKKVLVHAGNRYLIIAAITMVSAYFVLFTITLAVQTISYTWDTGDGIGSWTGTAQKIEHVTIFDDMKMHLNYVLSLIILPSLIMSWIVTKDRLPNTVNQYSAIFGIALMTIGVLFFYNFLTLLVIGGFVALQSDPAITTSQFFEMTLEEIVRNISFHITGVVLIIIGVLMFGKKLTIKENEK